MHCCGGSIAKDTPKHMISPLCIWIYLHKLEHQKDVVILSVGPVELDNILAERQGLQNPQLL